MPEFLTAMTAIVTSSLSWVGSAAELVISKPILFIGLGLSITTGLVAMIKK